jgi:glycosyltransferase involved in cell wall biosynthesis
LIDSYSLEMAERVEYYCTSKSIDCVIASQVDTLRYLECVPYIPAILEEVEVTGYYNRLSQESGSSVLRTRLTIFKVEQMLRVALKRGVMITVVSEAERDLIQRIAPSRAQVAVIPNGVDTALNRISTIQPEPNTLIYPGAVTYSANYQAVKYFIGKVLPLIHQQIPEATFMVTGGTGDVDVRDLQAQPGVQFTGYLPDVAPAVQSAWATVVPLTQGGGTRLKILESMALGTPVISTAKGAEGLAAHPGEELLVADDPQSMADAICGLLRSPDQRRQLTEAGRRLVEREYDWNIIGQQLLDLVNEVMREKVIYGQ